MGKRRHGTPERFQSSGFAIDERSANDEAALAAVKRFVETFVSKDKRERVQSGLLHRDQERRLETIHSAHKWIDPSLQSTLEGATGFPQHLHARFGDRRGVMIFESGARHVTVAGAAVLASGEFGALFMADSSAVALVFPEVGHPTLYLR